VTRDEDLAKLAARLTDQLGDELVGAYRDRIRITPPGRDAAVLACRCGTVLDAGDMCRRTHRRQKGDAARVDRITCAACADVTMPLGHSIAAVIRAVEAEDGAA
jgi:hypothetical protein